MLAAHRQALAALLQHEVSPRVVVIVGGGLYPRSALLMRELFPRARLIVLDAEASHLAMARPWLPQGAEVRVACLAPGDRLDADLVVLPLALRGSRRQFVRHPIAPRVLVHDWAWHRRGEGRLVAWWLCKRVYLVRCAVPAVAASA